MIKDVTVDSGRPIIPTFVFVVTDGARVQWIEDSVGPYIGSRMPLEPGRSANSSMMDRVSISPMVSRSLKQGAASLVRSRVPAIVGVSSTASIDSPVKV